MSEALAVITPEVEERSIVINRAPSVVLDEAKKAASALADVIRSKAKPVIFNGEQYLEFEDWMVLGRFYGISVRVTATTPVVLGDVHGWEAKAEAVHNVSGQIVSSADAMCLNDEPNWSKRPQFMLRSMAQTRACAKALRNVLAWVVVLAGYKPTPAEEMDGVQGFSRGPAPQRKPKAAEAEPAAGLSPLDALKKKVWSVAKAAGVSHEQLKNYSTVTFGKASSNDWTTEDCDALLLYIEDQTAAKVDPVVDVKIEQAALVPGNVISVQRARVVEEVA